MRTILRQEPLVAAPPDERLRFSVILPARNEEELLPSALRALAEQKTLLGRPLPHEVYEVLLLINNTTDRSRQGAENFRRLYPTFRLHILERHFNESNAHVGHARRLLMDEAARRIEAVGNPNAAILSTDADSQVAPNWIVRNAQELQHGAEAVGGRIIIPTSERDLLDPVIRDLHRYDQLYRRLVSWIEDRFDPDPQDPWPRHHQHFGASFAVTPRTYKLAGRLPPRRCFEDIAFYAALMRNDVRLRHSMSVKVFTSGRLSGRTRAGLSTQLSGWASAARNGLRRPVESAAFLEQMFATRRNLRLLWLNARAGSPLSQTDLSEVSLHTGMNPRQLAAEIRAARYFGLLLEHVNFYRRCRSVSPEWIRLAPLKPVVDELQSEFRIFQRARHNVSINGHSRSTQVATVSNPLERA